jgi:hypothetical protein
MKCGNAVLAGIAVVALLISATVPAPLGAQVLTVEMKPVGGTGGEPFPVGWAVINVPQGEVTMMAILPADTHVWAPTTNASLVFEGWLADLAPPHRCPPIADPPLEGEEGLELDASSIVGAEVIDATEVDPASPEVPICGSRLSSETGFRGFPGFINKTFQHTYFPVSQGVFRKLGPPLGDWQFYVLHHKTNMGLRPYDVVGVTIEPPGTGARARDYDPRPNPVVALAGRIPHPTPSVREDPPGPDPNPGPGDEGKPNNRRRPITSIDVR